MVFYVYVSYINYRYCCIVAITFESSHLRMEEGVDSLYDKACLRLNRFVRARQDAAFRYDAKTELLWTDLYRQDSRHLTVH